MTKNSKGGFALSIIVIVFATLAVALSIYYLNLQKDEGDSFFPIGGVKSSNSGYRAPLTALDEARLKAAKSRSLFNSLVSRYAGEQQAITSMQEEYAKMTDLLPSATSLILRKKLPSDIRKQITDVQSKIDAALKAWKDKLAQAKSKNPNMSLADLIAEAKKEAALLDQYTKELKDIVDDLTPENSGMNQGDIDAAKKAAEKAAEDAQKEADAIKKIEEEAKKTADKIPPTPTPTGVTNPPIVTPEDVDDAGDQAKKDEEEKKKAEEEAGIKKDVPLPTPTPTPDDYYSNYDNDKNKTQDPINYNDLTKSGKPEIDGSPSKNQ